MDFSIENDGITIQAAARCSGKIGIEMEALTAVSIAAMTIGDMCKAVDKNMQSSNIILIEN